ncbi:calcium-binding protein [uncultured Amaricoccus sp.]|uniref:calcium-binding protein n=1 Tax=uncultured Amaricoccus sp. TaxID=339341 RepID=UPI0026397839|nr:calcium-binding protein [uncultured Amaricoccus sp.]
MSINNSQDLLDDLRTYGIIVTEHRLFGANIRLVPGTYTPNWDTSEVDSVTFQGTAGRDALFGGGGEGYAFFIGTRGDDLYGTSANPDSFSVAYADYSGARTGIIVNMDYHGTRTFTDAEGDVRTVDVIGKASDGFGGTDYFAASAEAWNVGASSLWGVIGSSHRDVMVGDADFFGGRGNDLLIGSSAFGGEGNDRLVGRASDLRSYVSLYGDEGNDVILGVDSVYNSLDGGAGNDRIVAGSGEDQNLYGGDGNDCLIGSDEADKRLLGGAGDDWIFAGTGDDGYVIGQAGNDYIDGGAGDDFIDGGVGKDVLVSGSGNDIINPDVEYFQSNPDQARDGAKDVIKVTRADLGDYTDVVLSRAFEAGRDEIRFKEAVCRGESYRVFTEAQSFNDAGKLLRPDDLADRQNTVLQIDQDGDGFGGATPDSDDYFLVVLDATLSQHNGYLLT